MDAIPAAVGEEAAHAPLYIEEFKRWMRAQGKTDVLAKQTARSLVLLFEEDGKSIASMATPGYFDLVKPSEKNRLSHNQRSSALKHLQTFWQQRPPGPPEDGSAPDASPKQKHGSAAAPGSSASASAATPRSAGERQAGTPAQSAPDAKAFSPGSAGEGSARQDKGPDPPLSQDAKKGGGDRKAQRKRWKQRHRSSDVGVAAAPSLPMSAEHRREVQREKEKRKSERKQEVERKKQKKEEGEKPEHKRPPAVPLASAHGVAEILEQAKQLASEGRISKAVCVFGRDPSSKNSSVNGVYVDRDKPFHGRNAYKQEGGDRFLFYSSTKGAWKVSDSLDDSKNGFAFAKVDDRGEGLPSDTKHNLEWRVFGGKSEGYKKDRGLRCLSALALLRALAPESAAALAPDNDAADNCDESDGERGSGESSSCQQGSDNPSSDEKGAASSSGSSSGGES